MIGRILYDREEFVDELKMYNISVKIRKSAHGSLHFVTLKKLYDIARISQVCGEKIKSLKE